MSIVWLKSACSLESSFHLLMHLGEHRGIGTAYKMIEDSGRAANALPELRCGVVLQYLRKSKRQQVHSTAVFRQAPRPLPVATLCSRYAMQWPVHGRCAVGPFWPALECFRCTSVNRGCEGSLSGRRSVSSKWAAIALPEHCPLNAAQQPVPGQCVGGPSWPASSLPSQLR